ncbi:MAG: cysteine hydrolase [Rhodovibrionaceae bacterium]|nr:cysteine hydrolase [Rhodovibrionaceae bacterium]
MAEYTTPDRRRVALLTIEGQRDFTHGSSPVRTSGTGQAIPNAHDLVEAFRHCSLPIFHLVRLYRPDGSNVDLCRRRAVEEGMRILMPGTFGAELVDELKPSLSVRLEPSTLLEGGFQEIGPQEWVHYKPRWGGFYATKLESRLRELDVNTLVICGCNFPTAARATVYEASERDFRVVVASDALCGSSEDGLTELGRIGVHLMRTRNCLDWLNGKISPSAA